MNKGKIKYIKLYSTQTCPYCKIEKTWLDSQNIKHEVVYVDQNPEEARSMVKKTRQMGVPVTEIQYENLTTTYIVGFDTAKLSNELGIA